MRVDSEKYLRDKGKKRRSRSRVPYRLYIQLYYSTFFNLLYNVHTLNESNAQMYSYSNT